MKPSQVFDSFLGRAPRWYKFTVLLLLALNPLVLSIAGATVAAWLVLAEFIFVLAMTLQCYPLQPGGLLALEAVLMRLTDAERVYQEVVRGFPVILLLVFMLAGVYFLKDLLLATFTRLLLAVRSKAMLAFKLLPGGGAVIGVPRCADGSGSRHDRGRRFLCCLPPGCMRSQR